MGDRRAELPPGHQPWDVANGLRIGALVGGVGVTLLTLLLGVFSVWFVLAGLLIGGAAGYAYELRQPLDED